MDKKIKVAMGTAYPFDETRVRGGVEAVALHLVNALGKRDDIKLHVVSCNNTINRNFTEKRRGITFHWLAKGSGFHVLRSATIDAWRVRRVYKNINPDIIHAQSAEYAIYAPKKCPLLMTIHGVEVFAPYMKKSLHFNGLSGLLRQWGVKLNIKVAIKNTQAIVSIAGDYLPRIMSPLLDSKTIYNIPNPLSETTWNKTFSNGEIEGQILCVGSIVERKNAVCLVQAFTEVIKQCPNARLCFAGGIGEKTYYNRLLLEISKHGLDDKITLMGELNQSKLLKAYGQASIVVLPSIQETAPMVIAEAMALGKPVVATRVAAIPWMLKDGATGSLVEIGDKRDMAAKILDLLQNKSKRSRIGKAAKENSWQRFRADVIAGNTMQVYRKLIQPR